jgi:beta-lactamase class A
LLAAAVSGWRWWAGPAHAHPSTPAGAATGALAASALDAAAPLAAGIAGSLGALNGAAASLDAVPAARPDARLQSLVERLIDDENGDTAVVVRNLLTGASATVADQEVFPAASLAKVPILYEVYRQLDAGKLRRDLLVTITADDITDGAGVLQAREGDRLTIDELLDLAVSVSDNTAARMLLRAAGGVEAVNRTMAGLGLGQTRLYADARPNTTSAADMAALLTQLAVHGAPTGTRGQPASGGLAAVAPSPNTLAALLALRQAQAWLSRGVPKGVTVAHKSGQLPGVRHDAAIVYGPRGAFVVVGLTNNLADQDDAEAFLARLAREVYDYFAKP